MKKFLMTCALAALIAMPAGAAPQSECAYSPRQKLIRDARNAEQIKELIKNGVVFDETPRCGGTIMQLAIRRGNAEVLLALLQQDLKRASQIVSLEEFPIPGAPKKIPLWLFAAYYAPNDGIISLLMQALQQSNQSIAMTDDAGRNVLWYMDRNPVLRNTELYDALNTELLSSLAVNSQELLLNSAVSGNNAGANLTLPATATPAAAGTAQPTSAPAPSPAATLQLGQKPTLSLTGQREIIEQTR